MTRDGSKNPADHIYWLYQSNDSNKKTGGETEGDPMQMTQLARSTVGLWVLIRVSLI